MPTLSDSSIHKSATTLITFLLVAYALRWLLRRLGRSRPELTVGVPIAAALAVRVLGAVAVSYTSAASTLRGGDETFYFFSANDVANTPFASGDWGFALTHELHVFVLALQRYALDSPEIALRIGQIGIAVVGLTLLAVAVYDLAGQRAAWISAWLLALEPTGVFFSSLMHKESNMLLAGGLVAFGGATMWKRADLRALFPIVLGCLIAVATRPYAGWFLIAAGAAITLHAGLRSRRKTSARSLMLVSIVVLFGAVAAPTVLEASTDKNLRELQASQDAAAADEQANLSLERVDFSTRGAIFTNLPKRIVDVLTRPYPWQLGNVSQRFALIGTAVFAGMVVLLIGGIVRSRGSIMARAGPLIYVGFFLLVAYSLSAGNAGTAFRYRTHIVALGICVMAALRYAEQREAEPAEEEIPMAYRLALGQHPA